MPKRIDANQPAVVNAFRSLGCHVALTHEVGKGFPDIVVSWNGFTVLVEIKDGSKPPSKRKLTQQEAVFKGTFQGWYEVVESVEDTCKVFNRIRKRLQEGLNRGDAGSAARGREAVHTRRGSIRVVD